MCLVTVLLVVASGAVLGAPGQAPVEVLCDFEAGAEGWWGNVFNGAGTCKPQATDAAKFGAQALECRVNGVEGGSNTVSPWFPQDAPWRHRAWGAASVWVRGDGSRESVRFTIETGFDGEPGHETYSVNLPLNSREWRKVERPLSSFWNRHKVPLDAAKIGRIMFACKGTHTFAVDHVSLEATQRPVPLEVVEAPQAPLDPTLRQCVSGQLLLRFDPTPLPRPVSVAASLRAGGVLRLAVAKELTEGSPTGETTFAWEVEGLEGPAEITLTASRPDGRQAWTARYGFEAVSHKAPPAPGPLSLVPAPKECALTPGAFRLSASTAWQAIHGLSGQCQPAVNLLSDELTEWLGVPPAVSQGGPIPQALPLALVAGQPPVLSPDLRDRRDRLPPEGYVLTVTPAGVRLSARDTRGLVNGVCTLLQAVESHWAQTFELAAPCLTVVDWPSMPLRAINLPLPTNRWGHPNDAPVDPDFFLDFLRKTIVRQKLNTVCFIVQQAMQYGSHPEVAGPAAWDKETVKRLFDTMRRYAVEPVPECNSLGHANWLTLPHKELAEDGDVHQFCTSNPETKRILLDLYQELIDLLQPKRFHIGMDEIRWKTYALPEEKRCPLCEGKDKREVFVEWVTMLHDFFTRQGIEVMMWGDMLVPEHNGRAPYNLSDTVVRLPGDLLLCNWSTALAPESSHWFRAHGFEQVLKANSRGATRQEQQWCVGNMVGQWGKTPWLVEGVAPGGERYSYLSQLEGAEFSWNWWPDLFNPMPPVSPEFFAERPLAQYRLAARPVAGARPQPVPLPKGEARQGFPSVSVQCGGLAFETDAARTVAAAVGKPVVVKLGRQASALYFLHAAQLTDREALSELLKASTAWEGVKLGEYTVQYASGDQATVPVRYPLQVRDPKPGWYTTSLVYGAFAVAPTTATAEGVHLYGLQWVNPHPDREIASVTVTAESAPARLVLAGLLVQAP